MHFVLRKLSILCLVAAFCSLPGCGGGSSDSDSDSNSGGSGTPPTDPGTNPDDPDIGLPDPFSTRAVDDYAIYYGVLDEESIRNLETYAIAIIHPTASTDNANDIGVPPPTRDDVADIQNGIDNIAGTADDVTVYCYFAAGEDARTVGLSDEELLQDPRFTGDMTGPRVDPREGAPFPDGGSLAEDIDPKGIPSPGGTGYASWYLDDNDRTNGQADGKPDRVGDSSEGVAYVNFGDPAWFDAVNDFNLSRDGKAGLRQLLTTRRTDDNGNVINGFGCNGVVLDVVDPAEPNDYTDENTTIGGGQTEFEWIAPGLRDFIRRIKAAYPTAKVMQNRGLFYFDPSQEQFSVNPRSELDALLLEDYRLDENMDELYPVAFFLDDRYNNMPRLKAEAGRPDGFPIYSLDYAMGPPDLIRLETLRGGSNIGFDELLTDIEEAQDIAGFHHYFSNEAVTYLNDFVRTYENRNDTEAPVWSSTSNADSPTPPANATPPEPRVGIQEVARGNRAVTVRWDLALDRSPVRYTLYYQNAPFDYDSDPDLSNATSVVLTPTLPQAYVALGAGPHRYPYAARIDNLTRDQPYYFTIRAEDSQSNEENNRVSIAATPYSEDKNSVAIDGNFTDWDTIPTIITDPADAGPSSGPDWRTLQITNDDTNLYIRFTSASPFNLDGSPGSDFSRLRIYIDADQDFRTGFEDRTSAGALGSDLLIEGDGLFRQNRDGENDFIASIPVAPTQGITEGELAIPLSAIRNVDPDAEYINLVFENSQAGDYVPDLVEDGAFLEYRIVR